MFEGVKVAHQPSIWSLKIVSGRSKTFQTWYPTAKSLAKSSVRGQFVAGGSSYLGEVISNNSGSIVHAKVLMVHPDDVGLVCRFRDHRDRFVISIQGNNRGQLDKGCGGAVAASRVLT